MSINLTVNLIKKRKIKVKQSFDFLTLLLDDGRLATSHNSQFFIYNLENLKCDILINKVDISSIHQLVNGKIMILANTLEIYNISKNSFSCIYTIKNENLINSILPISNDIMISTGETNELTFWNSNHPYNVLYSKHLENCEDCLISYKTKTNNLLILRNIKDIKLIFYSLDTYKCIGSVPTLHETPHEILETSNNKLILSNCYQLWVIDLNNILIVHKYLIPYNKLGRCFGCYIEIDDNILLMGDSDGALLMYDFDKNIVKKQKHQCHKTQIKVIIKLKENVIATVSDDNTIKLWYLNIK